MKCELTCKSVAVNSDRSDQKIRYAYHFESDHNALKIVVFDEPLKILAGKTYTMELHEDDET